MIKRQLSGLREMEYIHDDEIAMRHGISNDMILTGLDKINDISVALMRRMILGRYIEVNEKNASELVKIVNDVCNILDLLDDDFIIIHMDNYFQHDENLLLCSFKVIVPS